MSPKAVSLQARLQTGSCLGAVGAFFGSNSESEWASPADCGRCGQGCSAQALGNGCLMYETFRLNAGRESYTVFGMTCPHPLLGMC